jgi:hypothetical protein
VIVPAQAAERRSIQPVVALTVNGGKRADIKVGESLTFSGIVEVPPEAGSVVLAEWDFDGSGAYAERSQITPSRQVNVSMRHTFIKPGTYFPALRVASHRSGDQRTFYALVQNLDRVRVVVRS